MIDNFEEQRIAVKNGMSEVQQLKTLIHEIAHAKLLNITKKNNGIDARRTKEQSYNGG